MTYKLEDLILKFSEHHNLWSESQKEMISNHVENFPDSPLPEHFKDDFSLPKALECICAEIINLKYPTR